MDFLLPIHENVTPDLDDWQFVIELYFVIYISAVLLAIICIGCPYIKPEFQPHIYALLIE